MLQAGGGSGLAESRHCFAFLTYITHSYLRTPGLNVSLQTPEHSAHTTPYPVLHTGRDCLRCRQRTEKGPLELKFRALPAFN